MSGRRLAVVGIAVCAVIATWLLWDTVTAPSTLPNGTARGNGANGDAMAADHPDRAAGAANGEQGAADRSDGSSPSTRDQKSNALQVQVRVLGIDGAPLAGIEVRYMDPQLVATHPTTAREWERPKSASRAVRSPPAPSP